MRSRSGRAGKAVQMALAAQVFGDGQGLVEALRLENHPDGAAHGSGLPGDIVAGNYGAAAGRHHHRGEDAEECGFPASIGPQQAEDLAGFYLEVDIRKGQARPILMSQVFGKNHNPGLSNSMSP